MPTVIKIPPAEPMQWYCQKKNIVCPNNTTKDKKCDFAIPYKLHKMMNKL
jgi:hypothetical protein